MKAHDVIEEVVNKYSEWLEMAGDDAAILLIEIMGNLLLREREEKDFYKKIANEKIIK